MFGKPLILFRVFGFEVKADGSWLILGTLIVWSLARGLFPGWIPGLDPAAYWLMGAAGAAGLFLSIAFHELCHSLVARRFVAPATSVQRLVEDYVYKDQHKMYPVVEGGRLLGCVTLDQVKGVAREDWPSRDVGGLARDCSADNTVGPDEDVLKALARMQRTGRSRLLVAADGKLAGIIALKDIMGFIALKLELEER